MAKPFNTTSPTHSASLAMPMAGEQPTKAAPAQADPTIRAMRSAGQDGESAGGVGDGSAPSNGLLGAYRAALVPPPGFRVP